MTESDLLALAVEGTDAVVHIVATAFTIVSAYIAGLHFFLNRAPVMLRLAAFALLSITLAFLGLTTMGLYGILAGADVAWRDLEITASGVASLGGEQPPSLLGLSVAEAGAILGFSAFGLVYLALAYMTFVYRWPHPTED